MGWGRMDDGFDEHHKVLALLDEEETADAYAAITLWTLCFSWAHRNTRRRGKTPGLIPSGLPRKQLGPDGRPAAKTLVKHGLWDEHPDGTWMIHDFADYLPNEETRAARAAAGRRGAASRWGSREKGVTGPDGNEPSRNGNLPHDSQDGDSKPPAKDGSRASARRVSTSSRGVIPEPTPEPDQPSAAGATQPTQPLSVTQRSKRITDAYARAEPMCKWPAVNGVVIKAIQAEKWTDDEIQAALLRMAKEGRSVTVDALRTELTGFTPRSRAPTAAPYRDPENQDDYDDWKGPSR